MEQKTQKYKNRQAAIKCHTPWKTFVSDWTATGSCPENFEPWFIVRVSSRSIFRSDITSFATDASAGATS